MSTSKNSASCNWQIEAIKDEVQANGHANAEQKERLFAEEHVADDSDAVPQQHLTPLVKEQIHRAIKALNDGASNWRWLIANVFVNLEVVPKQRPTPTIYFKEAGGVEPETNENPSPDKNAKEGLSVIRQIAAGIRMICDKDAEEHHVDQAAEYLDEGNGSFEDAEGRQTPAEK